MKVVSVEEMRRIDKLAQETFGFDEYDLMAAAGQAIAQESARIYKPEKICIVCGKGNNAGDGFVVARTLHEMGNSVSVFCLEEPSEYKGAAKTAWEKLATTKVPFINNEQLVGTLNDTDLIIDALLGTGISGPARANYASVIRLINQSGTPVVSADVPSGVREIKPGEDAGDVVRANVTLTVGLPKTVLLTLPGAANAGRVIVLTVNFPPELLEFDEWQLNWAPVNELAQWLPQRPPDSNKGTYGSVGVIGSALSYAGATVLLSRAALRSGCGLVTIYTFPAANAIYKTALPEATSVILDGAANIFDQDSAQSFESRHKKHTVLGVGPGLGTEPQTRQFLEAIMAKWQGPLVIDADALNIISDGLLRLLKNRGDDCIITPHPGEMARLTGRSVNEIQANRVSVARDFAAVHRVNVLLKGAGTIVARPDGQAWLIPGAASALAKGGTGDVLTGSIASLFAQGIPMWQAAVLAASAHLAAGHQCVRRYGSRGVLASEVADAIPLVLDSFQEVKNG